MFVIMYYHTRFVYNIILQMEIFLNYTRYTRISQTILKYRICTFLFLASVFIRFQGFMLCTKYHEIRFIYIYKKKMLLFAKI